MILFLLYGLGIASALFSVIILADWIFGADDKEQQYPYGIKRYDK